MRINLYKMLKFEQLKLYIYFGVGPNRFLELSPAEAIQKITTIAAIPLPIRPTINKVSDNKAKITENNITP